jgi:hypothetical protein
MVSGPSPICQGRHFSKKKISQKKNSREIREKKSKFKLVFFILLVF